MGEFLLLQKQNWLQFLFIVQAITLQDGLLRGLIRRALGLPGWVFWLVKTHKVSNKVSNSSKYQNIYQQIKCTEASYHIYISHKHKS